MTIHKSKGLQFPVVIYPFVDKDFSKPGKEGEWVELGDMEETSPLTIAWLSISSAMEGTPYEEIWTKEKGKTLLDVLNVMYVAFTRAVDKLFIISRYPDSGKFSEKNLAGFLQKFLEMEGLWNENSSHYSFGVSTQTVAKVDSKPEKEIQKSIFDEYISTSWAERISVRSRQMEIHEDRTTASERGSRIHDIMEKIHHHDDIPKALNQLFITGLIDQEEMDYLKDKITSIISHPTISQWYTKNLSAKNECGMYDKNGRFYRADRVVFDENKVVVIDYKTGLPAPEHSQQINKYADIIGEMGNSTVMKFLVFIDLGTVEEIA
jgi:ATP-dependent exoDNAse (exonuclease V) beta subunit